MKIGDKIEIVASTELSKLKLDELSGKTGEIIQMLDGPERKNKGCWAFVPEGLSDDCSETEWFIPMESIKVIA